MSTTGSLLSPGAIGTLDKIARRGFAAPAYKRKQETKFAVGRFMSLQECADEMHVTKECIRLWEVSALKKCRLYCQRHNYRLSDLL